MLLDGDIKAQLSQYLQLMEGSVLIKVSAGSDSVSSDMIALVDEIASMTSLITTERTKLPRTPSFSIQRAGEKNGITLPGFLLGTSLTRWCWPCCKSAAGHQRSNKK